MERKGCESPIYDHGRNLWVTVVGWVDVPDSDRDDFRRRRAVDISLAVSPHWNDAGGWDPFSWETRTCWSNVVNTIWDNFGYGLSQWETPIQCNVVSHWLSPYQEWSLTMVADVQATQGWSLPGIFRIAASAPEYVMLYAYGYACTHVHALCFMKIHDWSLSILFKRRHVRMLVFVKYWTITFTYEMPAARQTRD